MLPPESESTSKEGGLPCPSEQLSNRELPGIFGSPESSEISWLIFARRLRIRSRQVVLIAGQSLAGPRAQLVSPGALDCG